MNTRLFGTFTLRSPLSHISESISTNSYLSEEPVLQPDGSIEYVFALSGNSWRGQLRDLCAAYLLDHFGGFLDSLKDVYLRKDGNQDQRFRHSGPLQVALDTFHLLFSGGKIGGEQVIDVQRARAYRRSVPVLALFGGGVGNQILPGKLRVSNSYPVCREALPVLPAHARKGADQTSYRSLTFEKSFSRKDDSKDDRLRGYVAPAPGEQMLLDTPVHATDEVATQMRMTVELVAAGTALATEIDALDVSEIELGCLVSGLHRFSVSPHIGGQANKGHGRVELHYQLLDLDTGEIRPFVDVTDGPALLAPVAVAAKEAYDQHCRAQYDAMLTAQGSEIRGLLGVQ